MVLLAPAAVPQPLDYPERPAARLYMHLQAVPRRLLSASGNRHRPYYLCLPEATDRGTVWRRLPDGRPILQYIHKLPRGVV